MDALISSKGHGGVDEITDERIDHRNFVADAIDEQAEQDNADAKGPDAGTLQFTDLDLVQTKISHKLAAAEDHAADERIAGGNEGDVTAPKQDFIVASVHGLRPCSRPRRRCQRKFKEPAGRKRLKKSSTTNLMNGGRDGVKGWKSSFGARIQIFIAL